MADLWDGNDGNKNTDTSDINNLLQTSSNNSQSLQDAAYLINTFQKASRIASLKQLGLIFGGIGGLFLLAPTSPLLALTVCNAGFIAGAVSIKKHMLTMKETFNEAAKGFDSETVQLIAPIENALAEVKEFDISDLNPITMFHKNASATIFNTILAALMPGLLPGLYADAAAGGDQRDNIKLRVKSLIAASEMKARYPHLDI